MGFFTFAAQNARWLGAGFLLTLMSSFGQTFFISIFSEKIRTSFELTHGDWGAIYAVATMFSAAVMIWAGGLADRFKVRQLGVAVGLLLALAAFAMALTPAAWFLAPVIFGLRFSGQGMCTHIAQVAMARWFVATRGRALALSNLGYLLGEACLPVLFVSLMMFYDWQSLWAFNGVMILVSLPVLMMLLQKERSPNANQNIESNQGMGGQHWTRRMALRNGLFWSVSLAVWGMSAFGTAFLFHQVHFAGAKGWSHLSFVALLPIYTVSSVVCMMGYGWLIDRFGTGRILPFIFLPTTAGFFVFGAGTSLFSGVIGFVLLGMTSGAMGTVVTAFWAEFYGTRHIGAIKSLVTAVMVFGSAVGPGLTGYFIDHGVTLPEQFPMICTFFIAITALLFFNVRKSRALLSGDA